MQRMFLRTKKHTYIKIEFLSSLQFFAVYIYYDFSCSILPRVLDDNRAPVRSTPYNTDFQHDLCKKIRRQSSV